MFSAVEFRHKIIAKYIVKNIFLLYFAIFIILALIILGNRVVLSIVASYDIGASVSDILMLTLFSYIDSIPVLLSFSLFLAIIVSIGRFYRNDEIVGINGMGIGVKNLIIFIQPIVAITAAVIFVVVFYISPWSAVNVAKVKSNFSEENKINFIKADTFQYFLDNNVIMHFDSIVDSEMQNIFLLLKNEDVLITAASANFNENKNITLTDGNVYYGFLQDLEKAIIKFNTYNANFNNYIKDNKQVSVASIEELNLGQLLTANGSKYNIEILRRLSSSISIVILSILAIILAKTSIRSNSQSYQIIIGIIVFAVYYNALSIVESMIIKYSINQYIGFFGIHGIMLLLIIIAYKYSNMLKNS